MSNIKVFRGGTEVVRALVAMGIDAKTTTRVVVDLRLGEFPTVAVYRTASDDDLANLIAALPKLEPEDLDTE